MTIQKGSFTKLFVLH